MPGLTTKRSRGCHDLSARRLVGDRLFGAVFRGPGRGASKLGSGQDRRATLHIQLRELPQIPAKRQQHQMAFRARKLPDPALHLEPSIGGYSRRLFKGTGQTVGGRSTCAHRRACEPSEGRRAAVEERRGGHTEASRRHTGRKAVITRRLWNYGDRTVAGSAAQVNKPHAGCRLFSERSGPRRDRPPISDSVEPHSRTPTERTAACWRWRQFQYRAGKDRSDRDYR
jgi:hypothetical protein